MNRPGQPEPVGLAAAACAAGGPRRPWPSPSTASAGVNRGPLLAFLYSIGLGVPFLLVAASLHRAMDRLAVERRHSLLIMRSGGVLLVAIGLLQISGVWGDWLNALRPWIGAYGTVL